MSRYFVLEGNIDRLEKKLTAIQNKCNKNNIHFVYKRVGSKVRELRDENDDIYYANYIEIEVEGSFKYDNWEFAATLEHHENGNVIRSYLTDVTIPDKYNNCGPECEHCHKIRSRKDTYIIYNRTTNEFKQVGKSCLQDFTNGLNAEDAAAYISLFNEIIKGEAPYGGIDYTRYYNTKDIVKYAFETVKHFGYERADEFIPRPTKLRVAQYLTIETDNKVTRFFRDKDRKEVEDEMHNVNFNADSQEEKAEAAIEWAKNLDDTGNNYLHNLKVICSNEWTSSRDFGILVSIAVAYSRHLEEEIRKSEAQLQREKERNSDYIGNIGDKITITDVSTIECVYSSDSYYGVTFMYKIVDNNGNIYMWSTGNIIDDDKEIISISGTVKDHKEYKGLKQTWLTRCRIKYEVAKPAKLATLEPQQFNMDEIFELLQG